MNEIVHANAGAADFAALASLHKLCFADGWSAEAFAGLLATKGSFALISGSILRGLIVARVAADEAEILTLAVRPDCRGQGLGAGLVLSAARHAAASGSRMIFLEVGSQNEEAQRLYARLGFSQAGVRRGYYVRPQKPNEDAIVLRSALPLSPVGKHGTVR